MYCALLRPKNINIAESRILATLFRICQLSQSPRSLRTRRTDFLQAMTEDQLGQDMDQDMDTSRDTTMDEDSNQV
jgi:hypothetical protein